MHGVSHAFGNRPVLNDVTLEIKAGTVACLLGPSGCGKTTLLRLAAGLEPLQAGQISIDGNVVATGSVAGIPPEHRNVGLMFQDYALFPHLSVAENIVFGVNKSARRRRDWVSAALDRMGLTGFAGRYPHELSGGQQQRVALLRALASEPRILLLDEPFSGLDTTRRSQVREDTFELLKETGHTALMVTHDPEEAMVMSDVLLVMNEGCIVQSGTPVEIYKSPDNAFVAHLFGDTNSLTGSCTTPGYLNTPFGTLEVPGLAAGAEANVIVRSEGIGFSDTIKSSLNIQCTVTGVYPIGRSTQLRLLTENTNGRPARLRARVPGIQTPSPGSSVRIAIDPDHVFVFPTDN